MSNNERKGWSTPLAQLPKGQDNASASVNTFRQTQQQLFGAYPFASATPSTHVARHLSNMTISAVPPSYIQPSYYTPPGNYGNAPMYYAETSQLASEFPPQHGSDRTFWDAARNNTVRFLGDQSSANHFPPPHSYWNSNPAPSTYQQPAFAQSVMQQVAPYNAYPTPPPAVASFQSSSSSLAGALGPLNGQAPRPQQREERKPIHQYKPSESGAFFNNFLSDKKKALPKPQSPYPQQSVHSTTARPSSPLPVQSSPDPLLKSMTSSPLTPIGSSQLTPKKRKLVGVVLESPTKKAAVSRSPLLSQLTPLPPSSPRTPQTSTSSTVTKTERASTVLKSRMQVFVEVTPQRMLQSSPSQQYARRTVASSDLGGYGSEDEHENTERRVPLPNGRSTGKKTGERDERVPLEKFTNLLDDIFEAEDNISVDSEPSSLPMSFFSLLSIDAARPLLHPHLIEKLVKAISKIARPTKRIRLLASGDGNAPGTPRKAGGMAEVDNQVLVRVLKMLERSVRAGEDLDPFSHVVSRKLVLNEVGGETVSPTKKRTAKKKSETGIAEGGPSKPPRTSTEERGTPMDIETEDCDLSEDELNNLEIILERAKDSLLAANCCLALLTSDRLPKQLYSEDLITCCLSAVKNQLTKIIYPFVEAPPPDSREFSPLLMCITNRFPRGSGKFQTIQHRHLISEIFQTISAVLPRINNLICADTVAMSDSIVIQGVYIAIGPFFVVESGSDGEGKNKKDSSTTIISSTLGNIGMRGLRLEALSLVRNIFANYEEQRSWIIEEILSSLIKLSDSKQKAGQFRLRDGRCIRTVSALLLQLVQTSSHNIRYEARRIGKARQQQFAMKRQDSATADLSGALLDEIDLEETRVYAGGLEAPTRAAKAIVVFLTQRSGKGKSTKNVNEQEYRAIFDNLISDLLVVLFWPEWPAASLLLSVICKYMISSLDDVKSSNNDNNASKAVALDHLGVIAGRLRANLIKCGRLPGDGKSSSEPPTKALDEILHNCDERDLDKLIQIHQEISAHLSKRSSEDQAYESARELSAVMWGQELAATLVQLDDMAGSPHDQSEPRLQSKHLTIGARVKNALRDVWKDAPTDVFDNATQEEIVRIDSLSEQIGAIQILKHAFDPILNVIIMALDAPPVFVRTKALRALSHILTTDSNVLSNTNVRHAIESHLLDSSPQVREAAVELIGKYMVDSPSVAGDYYQKIAERIADTGLAVRKRVIKLLKVFYTVTEDTNRKIDICTKLVLRMLDEDDTVKDLAIKTLEELWFSQPQTNFSKGSENLVHVERNQLLTRVSVIMGVCGNFKDRQSPLEDMLSKIVMGKEGADVSALHDRYAELCDAMIDGLVDASDFMNFTVINCIRTVHLFAAAYPPIISGAKASTLLTYLKNPTSNEELITSDYILKIYRLSIPHLPKTAAKFGNDLQSLLQPMVVKPNPQAGLGSLQETVACLCAVVLHLTHDYVRLVALLKSCNARLQQYLSRPADKVNAQELRALHVLVLIVSLLGEHFDFDLLRTDQPDLEGQLNAVSKGSIIRHIYESILHLYDKYAESNIRGRLLQCLGFLFRAQPTLMTLESSATMMDAIFASEEEENRGRLLKLMQEFLLSESSKHTAQEKESQKGKSIVTNVATNMEELVGNTHGFAESGVSSAVIQRYLQQILDAALSPNSAIQASAVEILSYTIKQGLAHPLLSFPVIIALETSTINNLNSRAVSLHTILHHKHTSLLNSGFILACRKSHEYQCKTRQMRGESVLSVRGYRMQPTPNALLSRWYALVREKRATRQEFLRSVLKVFEIKDVSAATQDDVNFVRYMAENFASFDYRTQEEVLTVLKVLTRELAETGAQLLERVAPGNLLAQLKPAQRQDSLAVVALKGDPEQVQGLATPHPDLNSSDKRDISNLPLDNQLPLLRSSCITGMIMLLKAHLKLLYGLSEEKIQKFVLGKKSAVGDRPAIRKRDNPISWERMPFIAKPILTSEDMDEQKQAFVIVWNEDGVTGEPEEDDWD